MENQTSTMFTGVNVGYQGEQVTITDPAQAVQIVTAKLAEKDPHLDNYKVSPGVVVYNTDWGCPVGGEVVASVNSQGSADQAIQDTAFLRQELQQSTIGVASTGDDNGIPSVGFQVEVPKGDMTLQEIGKIFQDSSKAVLDADSYPYVGAGIYETGKGTFVIQGEANPVFTPDMEVWKERASKVFANVAKETRAEITPSFRDVNYSYLESPERIQGAAEKKLTEAGIEDHKNLSEIAQEMSALTLTSPKLEQFLDSFGAQKETAREALNSSLPYLKSAVQFADKHTEVATEIAEGAAIVKGDLAKGKSEQIAM